MKPEKNKQKTANILKVNWKYEGQMRMACFLPTNGREAYHTTDRWLNSIPINTPMITYNTAPGGHYVFDLD